MVAVVVVLLFLSGCSRSFSVGVRYREAQDLTFFVPLCDDDRLTELRVEEAGEGYGERGRLLWRIRSPDPGHVISEVEFGDAPPGFETLTPPSRFETPIRVSLASLVEEHGDEPLVVRAYTTGRNSSSVFELESLSAGGLVDFDDPQPQGVPPDEVERVQDEQCAPGMVGPLSLGLTVAGALWLVVYTVARRRRRIRRIAL